MTQTTVSTQSHGLGLDMVSLLYHKDIKAKTKSLAFSKLTHEYTLERSHAVTRAPTSSSWGVMTLYHV